MLSLPVLAGVLVWMAAVMAAAFVFQRAVKNSGWIDVFWTFGTGVAGIAAALMPFQGAPAARQWLAAALVAVWAARLGGYIAVRVARSEHEDARYARMRGEWGDAYQRRLFAFIMPQAAITALLCLSIQAAAHRGAAGLDLRDALGAAILAIAIGGEALADAQLVRCRKNNTGKGTICQDGLWAWSRHPNYFFEWFGWLAWPVIALDLSRPQSLATLIAPAAMYVVLRHLTGVRPLEASMLASRGEAFRAYQRRTSAFFPLPPKDGVPA